MKPVVKVISRQKIQRIHGSKKNGSALQSILFLIQLKDHLGIRFNNTAGGRWCLLNLALTGTLKLPCNASLKVGQVFFAPLAPIA